MNNSKEEFIKYFEELLKFAKENNYPEMNEDSKKFWDALLISEEKEKPAFTDNGKLILSFLKENSDIENWKSKDIAEGLGIASRSVAGTMRKLVSDGYVEKIGKDPYIYRITEKGYNIEFN